MNTGHTVGYMPMPADFPLKDLFRKGRPRHEKYDAFWCRHPPMDPGRRAKIFAPFDALVGFDDAIASKQVLYEPKRRLSEEEKERLNKKQRPQRSHISSPALTKTALHMARKGRTIRLQVSCKQRTRMPSPLTDWISPWKRCPV